MSRRDRARRRRNTARDFDAEHGPDPAEVVYLFASGWTIRRPGTVPGLIREGVLTDTCFKGLGWAETEGILSPEDRDYWTMFLLSLRDTDNIPKLTFLHIPGNDLGPGITGELLGFQNTPPKPEYLEYIDAWHDALPYPVDVVEIPELRAAA